VTVGCGLIIKLCNPKVAVEPTGELVQTLKIQTQLNSFFLGLDRNVFIGKLPQYLARLSPTLAVVFVLRLVGLRAFLKPLVRRSRRCLSYRNRTFYLI
jgi:hypothetical protein